MSNVQITEQTNGYFSVTINGQRKGGFISLEEAQAYVRAGGARMLYPSSTAAARGLRFYMDRGIAAQRVERVVTIDV